MTAFGIIFFVVVVVMMITYVSPTGRDMKKSSRKPRTKKPVRHPDPLDDRISF